MKIRALLLAPALGLFAACSSDSPATTPTPTDAGAPTADGAIPTDSGAPTSDGGPADGGAVPDVALTIPFRALVGAEPFSCAKTFANLGTTKATWAPTDLRFYVSDITLIDHDGNRIPFTIKPDGAFQSSTVALLDFEDRTGTCANGTAETHTAIVGTAPGGHHYHAFAFTLGVPTAENHQNAAVAAAPLNLSALFWNWQGGYKFARIDGAIPAANKSFVVHLGSTGCTTDAAGAIACTNLNAPRIAIDGEPEAGAVLALDKLFAGVALDADKGGMPGCMSGVDDPECGALLGAFGLNLATGASSGAGTVFTAP